MINRTLVSGGGGLTGAYSAGVHATLCRELGPSYFGEIFSCSVGTLNSTFSVSGQPEIIEHVWRNRVHGNQLVNFTNPLRKRQILDLDYLLVDLFQTGESKLNVAAVMSSRTKITYSLTNLSSGKPSYHNPSLDNIFDLIKASCSIPFVTSPVKINGSNYGDGSLTNPLPLERALSEDSDEIVVVYNKPRDFYESGSFTRLGGLMGAFSTRPISDLLKSFEQRIRETEELLKSDSRIKIIRPEKPLPLRSILDTDKERLNQTFDLGIKDAQNYLRGNILA